MPSSAIVIGAGPNGLSAAIAMVQAGVPTEVREAQAVGGGGLRSGELTLPGYTHDLMSAVHPMALSSPYFRGLKLDVDWIHPDAPAAHPLDDGTAVMLERDIGQTAANMGEDGPAYKSLMEPLADAWFEIAEDALGPIGVPRHPIAMARLAVSILRARGLFRGVRARAMFAGLAAHSCLPLEHPLASAIGLMLAIPAHAVGWPFPRGGSQRLADALIGRLESLGGRLVTSSPVTVLPEADAVLCDITPRQLVAMDGGFGKQFSGYRYGPGAYKVDWALRGPVPWTAKDCMRSATVHLGGTYEEIAASERGDLSRPYVLATQPSLFDASRAPEGRHTLWAYCHVPNGSAEPMLDRVEAQIERFAPGFRELVLARHVMPPSALEGIDANLIGGDINGGLFRLFRAGYRTGRRGVYLCSSSAPPGGGVHGMCGYHAAQVALRDLS